MDVAVIAHVIADALYERCDGAVIEVVQEAIHENEVVRASSRNRVGAHIGDLESWAVPSARVGDVRRVEIHPQVVDPCEVGAVRSWSAPHIEHAASCREVVVAPDGPKLGSDERPLPREVDLRPFEQSDDSLVHSTGEQQSGCSQRPRRLSLPNPRPEG